MDIEQERPYEDLRIIIKDNTPGVEPRVPEHIKEIVEVIKGIL